MNMDKTKMAVSLFLFSESIFFLILITTYVIFHGRHLGTLDPHQYLSAKHTGAYSLLLLLSSFTMWLSIRALRKNRTGTMSFWLALTIALGLAFLYGQGHEWYGLVNQDITISRDLFGATFFTLTGFHGFHVAMGLVMLLIILGISLFRPRQIPQDNAIDSISLYWHFVDGVWVVVFSVIYLAPYFRG
jgi:heme/copper-type cytochrome/quinol oxidase subunit 3